MDETTKPVETTPVPEPVAAPETPETTPEAPAEGEVAA